MVKLISLSLVVAALSFQCSPVPDNRIEAAATQRAAFEASSIHQFKVAALDGGTIDFASFKGKKILVVNTASKCGYTPQYAQLQELYELYKNKLVIIGCPSNDFGGQEPGTTTEIVSFCKKNYGVSFPLTEKMGILKNTHALYQWLTQKKLNKKTDGEVKWNFTKFLINADGSLYMSLPSSVSPLDDTIVNWLSAK